jgi:hypothetical protein
VAVTPLACAGVRAEPANLFPPSRQFVTVRLAAADPSLHFHIDAVAQDEPVSGVTDATAPDARLSAEGADSNTVQLRSELNPVGNGRVYRIAYTLSDGDGVQCSKSLTNTNVKVFVPRTPGGTAVDSAPPLYNSFTGAPVP